MTRETEQGYEQRDAALRPLIVFAVLLTLVSAAGFAVSAVLEGHWNERLDRRAEPHPMSEARTGPQGPRLQATTREELAEIRAREAARLNGVGWIDAEAGVTHIPIELAMELLLERGLPAREPPRVEDGR